MRTTRFQVPTTLEGMPVWMIDEQGPGCVDEDLSKNNRGPVRKRVGPFGSLPRKPPSEATPGRQVDLTVVMMVNGRIEIARIGGVRATEAVGGPVRGETAFQKREPSHHTPMQGLRRPLGKKERTCHQKTPPRYRLIFWQASHQYWVGWMQLRNFNHESRKARRRAKHHVWVGGSGYQH